MRLLCVLLFASALSLSAADAAKALEFPSLNDAKRIHGELVSVDFVLRKGEFRADNGKLMPFSMPPYAVLKYRGVEADLREVPLGTKLTFLMLPDAEGRLTRLVTTDDGQPTDAAQLKKFREFTEKRGIAGWIDKTEGNTVTVTFFSGDPAAFQSAYAELIAVGKSGKLCVANDELRTWNPGVDGEGSSITEVNKVPTEYFGSSGVQVTVKVSNMLEGFRRGRIVRVFLAGWKVQDQFYGESLMGYGFGRMLDQELVENVAKEYPEQFPFRTDYGNAHLPWYQLKDDLKPPPFSEHMVVGELIQVDAKTGSGQLLTELTGEAVSFTLLKQHTLKYLGADLQFAQLPTGQRYRFHMYQDAKGAFTRVSRISDDFSHSSANAITARVTAVQGDQIHVGWQLPLVKDYNGDMQRAPDIASCILRVNDATRVWKADQQVKLVNLQVGDVLLFNRTAELPGKPSHCTDIWIGEETHKLVTEKQRKPAVTKK
ncbi:MAG: hypothetical protein B7Z37_14580 [Verrucomicrobia bacterium 12-59-8]|nr:MAG: hypothetical protein B7Z37_14580 [Verrucomicrobia bacterium 12-59-8]